MARLYYSRKYGFRTDNLAELVRTFAARTGLEFEQRDTGAYNGTYYRAYDANECKIMAFRHFERESGEGWFESKWREFGVIVLLEGSRPIDHGDAIASLRAFAPTLLSTFKYDDDDGTQLEHQSWNPNTKRLEPVEPIEES